MGLRKCEWMSWMVGLAMLASMVRFAGAQGQNSFRDTTLPDSVRIQNLLSQLTLDEKVLLMSDHPKIPRLGIVFSGQVEGLHGLALGGPGDGAAMAGSPCRPRPFRRRKAWARPGIQIC